MDTLSNYEVLALYTTYTSDAGGHFMNFLAIFSAYLVAAYLVAGKLTRTTLIALSVLYVVVVIMTATGSYIAVSAAVDLAGEIASRNIIRAPNLVATARAMSGGTGEMFKLLNPAVQIIACSGSLVFAQSHRRNTTIQSRS